jgi:hypothetical protein
VRVRVSTTQPCVDRAALAGMLQNSGIRAVPDDDVAPAIVVEVRGTTQNLTVSVHGAGHEATTTLAWTRCEAASDVVAAFIVSALAPAPEPALPPPPRLEAAAVEKAVLDDLARRGVQPALIGRRVAIRRDASGTFFLQVSATEFPECSRTVALGSFEELSPMLVNALIDTITALFPLDQYCVAPLEPDPPRLRGVRMAVDTVDSRARATTQLGIGEMMAGGALLTLLAANHSPNIHLSYALPRDAFLSSASIVALGGGAASLFSDDDVKPAVVGITGFAAMGALFTGATLYDDGNAPGYTFASLAAGGYTTAAMIAVNAALRRPPISRLRAARGELQSSSGDGTVTQAERDIANLATPIPSVVTYAPLMIGGVIAGVPALASGFGDGDRNAVAGVGLGVALIGGIGMFLPEIQNQYRSFLEKADIVEASFGPGPGDRGGFSISGRF